MDWSRIPSLSALRAFEALARNGTLSSAARELNVTHAAIAQHLRKLETDLGEKLATRDGQALRLTDNGEELALALAEGFGRITEGVTTILDRSALRPITVTLTPTFAETWLMPRIGAFWIAHPDIELRLVPSISLADLRRDGIDLAIRFGQGDWPGLEVEPIAVSNFAVVAAPGYTTARSLSGLGDLSKRNWIFSDAAREQRVWGQRIGVDFTDVGAQEMPSNSLVLSAVRAGLGLSIQSRALVGADIENGHLVSLHEGDAEGLGYHLVTRPGVLSPGARVFRSWLRKTAKAES